MRAALLNSARMGAGPEDPRPNPLDVVETPVPGGVVQTGPPVRNPDGFSLEKAKSWWETGKKLADAGKANGMTVNPGAVLSAAATGAAAGAAIVGLGAIAGAAIAVGVYVIGALFGGNRPSQWDNAGPNVHWWFTNYAPQAYLAWIESTGNRGVFSSVQDSAKGLIVYWLSNEGYVLQPPPTAAYNGRMDFDYVYDATGLTDYAAKVAWLRQLYADFGIDYDATVDLWAAEGRAAGLMMKNRTFVSDAPQVPGEDETVNPSTTNAGTVALLGLGAAFLLFSNTSTRNG